MIHKILFSGPVGAGKTTAVQMLSDIEVVATEAKPTDETAQRKASTTVAMDFGTIDLGEGHQVHLYGTPGQDRFDYMWEILAKGSLGLLMLLDNNREDPIADLKFYLESFKSFTSNNSIVIGVTRMDLNRGITLKDYRNTLKELGLNIPVLEVDARQKAEVKTLLIVLLSLLDPSVKR